MKKYNIPSFEEVKSFWDFYSYNDVSWKEGNGPANALEFFRRIWDNYFQRKGMSPIKHNLNCISVANICFDNLADNFNSCLLPYVDKNRRWTHEDIYNYWIDGVLKVMYSVKYNKNLSLMDILYKTFKAAEKDLKDRSVILNYDEDVIVFSICVYFYRLSKGLVDEDKTMLTFNNIFKVYGIKIVGSQREDDRNDVDAYIIKGGSDVRIPVSIKNGDTLSKVGIKSWRENKGKTKPMLYCGLNNDDIKILNTSGDNVNLEDIINIFS